MSLMKFHHIDLKSEITNQEHSNYKWRCRKNHIQSNVPRGQNKTREQYHTQKNYTNSRSITSKDYNTQL